MASGARDPNAPRERLPAEGQLDYLTGARFLGAIWIVCAHYLPKGPLVLLRGAPARVPGGFLNGAALRDNAAVDFFVVLSGFMTHWAYGGAVDLLSLQGAQRYYLRRLGRTLLTTWLSMLLGWAAQLLLALQRGAAPPDAWHVVRCLCFAEQWRALPGNWCPSGPSWFVFALLPAWLLYPLFRAAVTALEERGGALALLGLAAALYCVSFGPTLFLFLSQGYNVTFAQRAAMMYYPHVQLADFAIGILAAAGARRHRCQDSHRQDLPDRCGGEVALVAHIESPAWLESGEENDKPDRRARRCGWLADACAALVVGGLCLVPTACPPHGFCQNDRYGWEPLLDHGFALAIAGFLYGSATARGRCVMANVLSHRTLVELGKLSFEVYIFQEPVHQAFQLLADTRAPEAFMAYLLFLFAFAALYDKYVQTPLVEVLRGGISGCLQLPKLVGPQALYRPVSRPR